MLAVALSGLLGKYLYIRIHHGLHGRVKRFNQLRDYWQKQSSGVANNEPLEAKLNRFEQPILDAVYHPIKAVLRLFLLSLRGDLLYLQTRNLISEPSDKQQLRNRIKAACELAEFSGYERLFSLWHVVHIPFFFIMLAAGIAHITAVHLY